MPTVVVDNGGCCCRVGWSDADTPSIVAPNATATQRGHLESFVGDQITRVKNQGTLTFTRPIERGIVTNWPCQLEVWKRLLPQAMVGNSGAMVAPRNATLLVTSAPFTPTTLTGYLDEIVFEELGFGALQRLPAPAAVAQQNFASGGGLCCLVVDLGFSATYAIPTLQGRAVQKAARRLNIGGRMMTAYLQECLTYRQYNMMDEVSVVNCAKEALSYVAPSSFDDECEEAVGPQVRPKGVPQ